MSHVVTRRVMDECEVRGQRRAVMMSLAHYADDDGHCWPSQRTLADDTKMSVRGIQKIMDALLSAGEIEMIEKGNGRGNSTHYQLSRYITKGEQTPIKGRTDSSSFPENKRANFTPQKGEQIQQRANFDALKGEQAVRPNTSRIPIEPQLNTTTGEPIPADLDTPEFREAWERFKKHRKQIRKPFRGLAEQMQLRHLLEMGVLRAVLAINHSIAQGWQGIFEPNGKGANGAAAKAAREAAEYPEPREVRDLTPQ